MAGMIGTRKTGEMAARSNRRWLAPFQDLEDVLERFWADQGNGMGTPLIAPPLDMTEKDGEILLRMDLPGIDAKDIDIQVNGSQLTISGERKEEKEESGETYHRIERRSGRFSRSVLLPCDVQESKVDARYVNGVLTIRMPKTAEATSKHIVVKT